MSDVNPPPETTSSADIYEEKLTRQRDEASLDIKILFWWFFALHGRTWLILCLGVFISLEFLVAFGSIALGTLMISVLLALVQGITTLHNAPVLPWRMIALGMFPWAVIAMEASVVLLGLVLD